MGKFPNHETKIGQPGGPKPGRQPGILVGKKRAKVLQRAAAEAAVVAAEMPEKDIHPRAYFQLLLNNAALPHDLRGAAARSLAQFWPKREDDDAPKLDLSRLTEQEIETLGWILHNASR